MSPNTKIHAPDRAGMNAKKSKPPKNPKTVLILEDVSAYSTALEKFLRGEDCVVVLKTTRADAKKYLEQSQPDLIFCDGEAPDGTFIHAIPNHLWGRVIGISGSPGYNEAMKQRGAMALAPKRAKDCESWATHAVEKARPVLRA